MEKSPSEDGRYIVHFEYSDTWDTLEWNDNVKWLSGSIDYFIPIRLDVPDPTNDKEDDVSELIWEGNSFEIVPYNKDDIAFRDIFLDRDYFIWWNKIEAISLGKSILNYYGYDVSERKPEIAPCPFCGGECHKYGCQDARRLGKAFQVRCVDYVKCGYFSAIADTPAEAIRLHNGISGRV